jgi:hypothetical protein
MARVSRFRPAGAFVRTTFGTGFRPGRNHRAAIGTDFGRQWGGKAEGRIKNSEKTPDGGFGHFCLPPSAFFICFFTRPRRRIPRRSANRGPSKYNRA